MKGKSINVPLLFVVVILSMFTVITGCKKEAKVSLPVLTTNPPTDITPISASLGGTVTSEGGESTDIRGISFDTISHPTSYNYSFGYWDGVSGLGIFSFPIIGLKPMTKYYVRAFAKNSAGTGYGNEISFTTPAISLGQKMLDGIIFLVDSTGEHGLIAATEDQGNVSWYYNGNYIATGATGYEGWSNTQIIISEQGNGPVLDYAAIICWYYLGCIGCTDSDHWYLPSKDELDVLYKHKNIIEGLSDSFYWSSSEVDDHLAWAEEFSNGHQSKEDKSMKYTVRPIRAF